MEVGRGHRHRGQVEIARRSDRSCGRWIVMTGLPLNVPERVLGDAGRHHDVRHRHEERDANSEHQQHARESSEAVLRLMRSMMSPARRLTSGRAREPRRTATPCDGSSVSARRRGLGGPCAAADVRAPSAAEPGPRRSRRCGRRRAAPAPAGPQHGERSRGERRHQPPQHPHRASCRTCRPTEVRASAESHPEYVRLGRRLANRYGVPTHSSVPSANPWCFQIGVCRLSSSISCRAASNASSRCGAETATTTAMSPIVELADPMDGRDGLDVELGRDLLGHLAHHGLGGRVRAVVERRRRPARGRGRERRRRRARFRRPRGRGRPDRPRRRTGRCRGAARSRIGSTCRL